MFSPFQTAAALSILLASAAYAGPVVERQASPTVQLDNATFTGVSSGTSSTFLGIPFAKPPVGDLRFHLPQTIPSYSGAQSATAFGPSCPQQGGSSIPTPNDLPANSSAFLAQPIYHAAAASTTSEDCLTINVWKPATATPSSKLAVAVWIYGGGFEGGGTNTLYDGGVIVDRSITLGEPVVYVSMNYRVSAWGFLASKEVKAAGVGNLGLQDQRQALRWVQKYIAAFGGDPTKVTIWGESAGSISVSLQMLANGGDTEGLFRGGFMESGSPIPVGDIAHGQVYYDSIVADTGCSGASDTLQCLRGISQDSLQAAVNKFPSLLSSYKSLVLTWIPRVDGVFLTDNPQQLVAQGKVANIPIVNGDCDDEGTLFSFSTLNITTTAQLREYIKTYWAPNGDYADIDRLLQLYPEDITQGSPFDTGILNAITPQFKRIAAFQGDLAFQAPRRYFLGQRSGKQAIWSFLIKRLKLLPVLGSLHASDIVGVYTGFNQDLTDFVINFVNTLDPNGLGGHLFWPQWTADSPNLMTLLDGLVPETITQDTYRKDAMDFATQFTFKNPI